MSLEGFRSLEDVVRDPAFAEVDLLLRQGRHIDVQDVDLYELLSRAQALLEEFYRPYGCELIKVPDGYFYLLPSGDKLGRRHLSAGEMLVGMALALVYLDPASVETQGVVTRSQVLELLAHVVGEASLLQALNPRRRGKRDQRVEHELARQELEKALRSLAALGFVDLLDPERLRVRRTVNRFSEAARGNDLRAALERLLRRGEAVLVEGEASDQGGSTSQPEDDHPEALEEQDHDA